MIALGLLLVVAALVLGAGGLWLTASSTLPLSLVAGPLAMELPAVTLFVLGMLSMGLLWLGWLLLRTGTRRKVRTHRERRQVERDLRERESHLSQGGMSATSGPASPDREGDLGFPESPGNRPRTD